MYIIQTTKTLFDEFSLHSVFHLRLPSATTTTATKHPFKYRPTEISTKCYDMQLYIDDLTKTMALCTIHNNGESIEPLCFYEFHYCDYYYADNHFK